MRLIATITDRELGLPFEEFKEETRRLAVRAVLRKGGRIAILRVTKRHHHKLPGGGVEEGEDIMAALKREILEETGCVCDVVGELGMTVEYRREQQRTQRSYCYIADVTEVIGEPELTPEERAEEYRLIWPTIDEAIQTLERDQPTDYVARFVQYRDLQLLKAARENR